jgi:hypothetical protein
MDQLCMHAQRKRNDVHIFDIPYHHGVFLPGTPESPCRKYPRPCNIVLNLNHFLGATTNRQDAESTTCHPTRISCPTYYSRQGFKAEPRPEDVLLAYRKKPPVAHQKTDDAKGSNMGEGSQHGRYSRRDARQLQVEGHLRCPLFPWSLFRRILRGRPPVVRLLPVLRLRDADAYPFVMTNVSITLRSFESTSDTWGRIPWQAHS